MTKKLNETYEFKQKVIKMANREAAIWGTTTLAAVAAATALASHRYEGFRKYTSMSAKTSFAPMAGLGVYYFKYEAMAYGAMADPAKYGLAAPGSDAAPDYPIKSNLPYHKRMLNAFHDNPYILVAGLGVPLATGILYQQLQKRNITVSSRIMHSRVYAQFGIIAIFVISMGLVEYMRRHGKFEEPVEEGGVLDEAHMFHDEFV